MRRTPGGVPERPKGTGCKPVGSAYGGSNPPAPISPTHALLPNSGDGRACARRAGPPTPARRGARVVGGAAVGARGGRVADPVARRDDRAVLGHVPRRASSVRRRDRR